MKRNKISKLTVTALLIALGILIPMISPFKILLEPASFTLASHVPTMIAMLISPTVAATVALGTAAGFFLGGFPIVITLRALTHIVFAWLGGWFIAKNPELVTTKNGFFIYNLIVGILHAVLEVIVVFLFYFSGSLDITWQVQSIFLLVGIGTVVHSMIDFYIAKFIWKAVGKNANPNIKFK